MKTHKLKNIIYCAFICFGTVQYTLGLDSVVCATPTKDIKGQGKKFIQEYTLNWDRIEIVMGGKRLIDIYTSFEGTVSSYSISGKEPFNLTLIEGSNTPSKELGKQGWKIHYEAPLDENSAKWHIQGYIPINNDNGYPSSKYKYIDGSYTCYNTEKRS